MAFFVGHGSTMQTLLLEQINMTEESKTAAEELMEQYLDDGTAEAEEAEETTEEETEEETGEEAKETTEEEAEEETEEEEEAEDDLELSEEEAASLKASAKEKVNKRIGEFRSQLTEAQSERDAALERAESAETEAENLRSQLDKVDRGQVMQAAGIEPIMVAESESEIDEAESNWRNAKRSWRRYENTDLGLNDDGKVIAYQGKDRDGNDVEYTRDEVMGFIYRAEDMLESIIPQARKAFSKRKAANDSAAAAFPEIFKKGTPEAKEYADMMRQVPGLNALPNAAELAGSMIAGRKLLDPKTKQIVVGGRTFVLKGGKAAASEGKKVPKVPKTPVPAGRKLAPGKQAGGSFDGKAVSEAADSRKAAESEYLKIV